MLTIAVLELAQVRIGPSRLATFRWQRREHERQRRVRVPRTSLSVFQPLKKLCIPNLHRHSFDIYAVHQSPAR